MKSEKRMLWVWVMALLVLLLAGLGPSLPQVVARIGDGTPTSDTPLVAATPMVAGFDQDEAVIALQTRNIDVYEAAAPAVVNITNRGYVYYRFGGAVPEYSKLMTESRDEATANMIASAQAQGADAIVAVRYTTSTISAGVSEILAFGTAVKLR